MINLNMIRESDTGKSLRELFKHSFLANCHLDGFDVTEQEIIALQTISIPDILEGFKELILALLKFKKQQIDSWSAAKKKIESMEKEAKDFEKIEKRLKEGIEALKEKLRKSEEKCEKLERTMKENYNPAEDPANFTLHKRFSSANATGKEWGFDCEGFLTGLSESFNEIEKPSKVVADSGIKVLKEKLREKSSEISKIQDKIREKIYTRDARVPSPPVSRLFVPYNEELAGKGQENTWDLPFNRHSFSFQRNHCDQRTNKKY